MNRAIVGNGIFKIMNLIQNGQKIIIIILSILQFVKKMCISQQYI